MIHPNHFQEWLASRVDEAIVRLNVFSLKGEVTDYGEPDYPIAEFLNISLKRFRWINRQGFANEGKPDRQDWARSAFGWICQGVDPLNDWQTMLWGCFKPDKPWIDIEGGKHKPRKYEHPSQTETRAFFLRVPLHVFSRIAFRYGVAMPDAVTLTQSGEALGFWAWVLSHPQIPITITEGAKKAGALLTIGYAAVALPGIFNGYRQPKNRDGTPTGSAFIIPDLAIWAVEGRSFYFAFDNDKKPKTIANLNQALAKTGSLLAARGCCSLVVSWSQEQEKGRQRVYGGALVTDNRFEIFERWLERSRLAAFDAAQEQVASSVSTPANTYIYRRGGFF